MSDIETLRQPIAGSERDLPAGAVAIGAADPTERTTVTIIVRVPNATARATAMAAAVTLETRSYMTRETFSEAHGAARADILAVERFALAYDLIVCEADFARRSIVVDGTLGALGTAFGATLQTYRAIDGNIFRGRTGSLSVPASLAEIIVGVFGLDDRPQARPQFRRAIRPAVGMALSYDPTQIAAAYAFPPGNGRGQTIALVELGGGYTQTDLATYFSRLGITAPNVSSVAVDGGTNAPTGDPQSADTEVLLDIEVAGAIAPGANVVVYFAPNTDRGFLDAITTAIHDAANRPQILSISWGSPESRWTAQALAAFDAAFADAAMLGVTVLCASGDNGSSDGVTDSAAHVDFPASSPHVLACGGTRLELTPNNAITSERVWNDGLGRGATGGGVSDHFDVPTWQQQAGVPPSTNPGARIGRGVPDVAGDADPQTGYAILVDGVSTVVGGTSAVAPLWAALIARLNAVRTQPLGFLNPRLYANPGVLRDIVDGDNGAYAARSGWDACTGLGSPNGTQIAALLAASPAPPTASTS